MELSGDGDRIAFEDQTDDGWFLETAVDKDIVRQRLIRTSHCLPLKLVGLVLK